MRLLTLLLCLLLGLAGCGALDQTTRQQLPPAATVLSSPASPTAVSLAGQPAATPVAAQETPEQSVQMQGTQTISSNCPFTEPIWAKPPDDSAVRDPPGFGNYFVNEDRSIWASAWWTGRDDDRLRVSEEGIKVGWFRPAGATLTITGQRIDRQAPALEAHVPCCYPTRFQATGVIFPTEGCWEVTAKAAESKLSFVVWVEP